MILHSKPIRAAAIASAVFFVTAPSAFVRAQEPAKPAASLIAPAPFSLVQKTPPAPGPNTATELDARRALQIGLPSIATEIYQQLLAESTTAAATRNRIVIDLATALIEEDRIDEAAKALQQFSGSPTPALLLRQALIDARQRRFDKAGATATALRPEELSPADRGWLFYLRGMLADEARDYEQSGKQYQQAEAAAISDAQRVWFKLAHMRTSLFLGEATEASIATHRQTIDRNPGSNSAYLATSQVAVALNLMGRRAEAVTFLQTRLQYLSPQETGYRDTWLQLLGLIAGPSDNAGRDALLKLLTNSPDQDKQRAALRLLANASRKPPASTDFQTWLNQLIAATPPHPILADLLLFRAQISLATKDFPAAENDANRLRTEFPGSNLRTAALGILTATAWEQGSFRLAASKATEARDELKAGDPTGAQLGVLIAEAYYRARDFRSASDAYRRALTEVPAGVNAGSLMFQHVYSELQSGQNGAALDNAQKILDGYATDRRFDADNHWRAEWNLDRALQAAGKTTEAFARVTRLLDAAAQSGTAATLPADLHAQMLWLQTHLAFDLGNYAQALAYADKLPDALANVNARLRTDILSTTMLRKVEAGFKLTQAGQPDIVNTSEVLEKLRTDYPKSDAAVRSYLVEADDAANRGQLVEAQNLLQNLADNNPAHSYAPYALYQAAIYAERRAQDQYYRDAYKILETLATNYPQSDLVFYARLKQGNLARAINDYDRALAIYEELVNRYKYPQHPEGLIAEMARADCYAAYAATDPSQAENAAVIYERLLDQPTAPIDLRVEAGYKFGLNLIARNTLPRLETIWMQMINNFLLDDAGAAKLNASPKGRYWMARTLLKLGEVLEQQSKAPQACKVYEILIQKNLPGAALAQERITRSTR